MESRHLRRDLCQSNVELWPVWRVLFWFDSQREWLCSGSVSPQAPQGWGGTQDYAGQTQNFHSHHCFRCRRVLQKRVHVFRPSSSQRFHLSQLYRSELWLWLPGPGQDLVWRAQGCRMSVVLGFGQHHVVRKNRSAWLRQNNSQKVGTDQWSQVLRTHLGLRPRRRW